MSEEQESLLEPVSMLNEDWQIISEQAKRIKELEELYANEEHVCTQLALECFRKDAKLWGRAATIRRLLADQPPPLTLEEADHIANIMVAYPLDPDGDVNLAIRKRAEWLRDYINGRGRHE